MTLLRPRPSKPDERTAAEKKIEVLENEIRELRPSSPPSGPPPRYPADRSARALLLLGEKARQQSIAGHFEAARKTIGEGVSIIGELTVLPHIAATHALTIAHASVMIGEAMLGIDAPTQAKPQFVRALEILDRIGNPRWRVRARLGLGRALIALDDATGLRVLEECHQACKLLNEKAALVQIEEEMRTVISTQALAFSR